MNESSQWYVAVEGTSVGPVSTELVTRGIEHGRIPQEALVCEVGASAWAALSSIDTFRAAVLSTYPPPAGPASEQEYLLERGFYPPSTDPLPSFAEPDDFAEVDALAEADVLAETEDFTEAEDLAEADAPAEADVLAEPEDLAEAEDLAEPEDLAEADAPAEAEVLVEAEALAEAEVVVEADAPSEAEALVEADAPSDAEALAGAADSADPDDFADPDERGPAVSLVQRCSASDIEVDIDLGTPLDVDWTRSFHAYLLVDDPVELPEELVLLESLSRVSRDAFRHDEAMWNLALCLVFGSESVGDAAAAAFFGAVAEHGALDRLEWMSRTLLGTGFFPTGIPADAGRRAFGRLLQHCPPSLAPRLLREVA